MNNEDLSTKTIDNPNNTKKLMSEIIDKAYSQGVEHCISVVELYFKNTGSVDKQDAKEYIINSLNKLKK